MKFNDCDIIVSLLIDSKKEYMFCGYVSSRNEECDCVVGWYEKKQGKKMFYSLPANSLDFWYARGRHILTEVIRDV